jgi:CheY-like chemotaxis protein
MAAAPAARQPRARLLIVTDSPDRAEVTARALSELGYEVRLATPNTAADRCRRRTPHAVLVMATDVQTERTKNALREVKDLPRPGGSKVPVIVAGDPQDEALSELVDGVVLEPDRLTSLVVEIAKHVDPRVRPGGQ